MANINQKKVIPIQEVSEQLKSKGLINQLRENRSNEVVFAVVGYAGSGTTFVISQLSSYLRAQGLNPILIKARTALDKFALSSKINIPSSEISPIERTTEYQRIGDELRKSSGEYGAVAAYMIREIKKIRGEKANENNVYILDSLKHPQEVDLLKHVYGNSFCLIGVGCRPDIRTKRLQAKFKITDANDESLKEFVNRDAEDSEHKYGQQVNDTFHRADYFVDNTPNNEATELFKLPDELKRLYDIVFTGNIHRPRSEERGMYHANAAAMRSSCLSRQVGASILDGNGDLIAVGANEVPKFGGGSYGESDTNDDRCFKERGKCSNTVYQQNIIEDVFSQLSNNGSLAKGITREVFDDSLKTTRLKSLIEFSRSIHAEMDALLGLVRSGTKLPENAVLFTTTYPCHNCARHIVAAGVKKVIYLEPYAKSLAIDLHEDSIADNKSEMDSKGKVRFLPYQGVSPNLYKAVYLKTDDLKDKKTGELLPDMKRRDTTVIWTKTYKEFEDDVIGFLENIESGLDNDASGS
jgi:deoxycytidylate deaminase